MSSKWQKCAGLRWVVLTALLSLVLTRGASAAPLEVTASLPMVGEWVQIVGGEHVRVRVIAPAGADPHAFDPSVRSIQAVNRSQALFIIGLGLEVWAERLMLANPTLKVVPITPSPCKLRPLTTKHTHPANHHHPGPADAHAPNVTASDTDHHHPEGADAHTSPATASDTAHPHVGPTDAHASDTAHPRTLDSDIASPSGIHAATAQEAVCAHTEFDPHVWLDPLHVKEMVRTIAHTLTALAPHHANHFTHNADAYCEQLDALHGEIITILAPIAPQRRKLVTNHDNLHYFASRYGFVVLDALLGTQGTAGGQPSARRVRDIVARIRESHVTAVFADAASSSALLEAVAAEAGIAPPGTLYSIPTAGSAPAANYLQMMRHNANEVARLLAVAQPH